MSELKKIVVIDGQGGGLGRAIIEQIRLQKIDGIEIIAVGTNALATVAMLKAGANAGATGEGAVIFNCRQAWAILGAFGIIAAGAMLGELTGAMAQAVSYAPAVKILVPMDKCNIHLAGLGDIQLSEFVFEAVTHLKQLLLADALKTRENP